MITVKILHPSNSFNRTEEINGMWQEGNKRQRFLTSGNRFHNDAEGNN